MPSSNTGGFEIPKVPEINFGNSDTTLPKTDSPASPENA
jgi:hypothetical protein